jgi:hypothetical protein
MYLIHESGPLLRKSYNPRDLVQEYSLQKRAFRLSMSIANTSKEFGLRDPSRYRFEVAWQSLWKKIEIQLGEDEIVMP